MVGATDAHLALSPNGKIMSSEDKFSRRLVARLVSIVTLKLNYGS